MYVEEQGKDESAYRHPLSDNRPAVPVSRMDDIQLLNMQSAFYISHLVCTPCCEQMVRDVKKYQSAS